MLNSYREEDAKYIFDFLTFGYQDVVSLQLASGGFKIGIRNFVQKFAETQVEKFEKMSEELINTIIGIKMLQEHFQKDKAKWKFVVQKSKKYLL